MVNTLSRIRECISALQEKFLACPSLYFNESDLQSELFALLLKQFDENKEITNVFVWGTEKPLPASKCLSRSLHSELLLYNGRIDLAILDLENVRFAMNSRGRFGYIQVLEGSHVFIEIKASRTNRSNISSKNVWFKLILSDIEKLNQYKHPCFMLSFDFNRLLDDSSVTLLKRRAHKNVEVVYARNEIGDLAVSDSGMHA